MDHHIMWACYKACKGPAWNEESTSQVEPSAQVLVKVLILSALFGSLFYPDSRRPLSALCFCIQSNEAKGETKWFIFCQLFQPCCSAVYSQVICQTGIAGSKCATLNAASNHASNSGWCSQKTFSGPGKGQNTGFMGYDHPESSSIP